MAGAESISAKHPLGHRGGPMIHPKAWVIRPPDHFAQCDVLGRKLFERLDQCEIPAPEDFHASRDRVHQDVAISDDLECLFKVVVSHG
jgi:hypothetical protein